MLFQAFHHINFFLYKGNRSKMCACETGLLYSENNVSAQIFLKIKTGIWYAI